jgi:uncharacterized protein YdcH (DUF465 family)
MSTADLLKIELMDSNEEYRSLAEEHKHYEVRLTELVGQSHLSEDEKVEIVTLKKKKLACKDAMETILQNYKKAHEGH